MPGGGPTCRKYCATDGDCATGERCHNVTVGVTVSADLLRVDVTDDGVGIDPAAVRGTGGLANLTERARHHGGTFTWSARQPTGTALAWSVPL